MKKVKTYISMALIGAMALSFTGCNMIKRTARRCRKYYSGLLFAVNKMNVINSRKARKVW